MTKIIKHYQLQAHTKSKKNEYKLAINQEELNSIKQQAQQSGFEQGYQQGHEQGKQQGYEEGNELAQQQLDQKSNQLNNVVNAIDSEIQAQRDKLKPQLFAVLESILPNFFLHNAVNKSNIEHAINRVLAEADNATHYTIKLSNQDLQLLQQQKIQLNIDKQHHQIIGCDEVELGGCILQSEGSVIDGRLEVQLEKLKQLLLEYKRKLIND